MGLSKKNSAQNVSPNADLSGSSPLPRTSYICTIFSLSAAFLPTTEEGEVELWPPPEPDLNRVDEDIFETG